MSVIELGYGHKTMTVDIPANNLAGVYLPNAAETQADESAVLQNALAQPIGSPRLRELVKPGETVVIVTSDLTRPCPSDKLLPPLLAELTAAGVPDSDITVVAALGLHRPMTEAELETMAGPEVYRRVRVINSDPADTVKLGVTERGTPVEIFRPVVEADRRICLGNLELHYFAGYSGGAKAILPGCASKACVSHNHAMLVQPEATTGRIDGNPVRADLEEGVAMLGVDFILNAIVGADHKIKAAVAGDVITAHRAGCEWVARQGKLPLERQTDIVVVSAGGFPKDINLYQAQKALIHGAYAARDGGIVILLAECSEGFGHAKFEQWLTEADSPQAILDRLQAEFVLGAHKAAIMAEILLRVRIFMVSAMPAEIVTTGGMEPFTNLSAAMQAAFAELGPQATISVFPQGGSVLPEEQSN
jgi:nickel-dependent lactate racemase